MGSIGTSQVGHAATVMSPLVGYTIGSVLSAEVRPTAVIALSIRTGHVKVTAGGGRLTKLDATSIALAGSLVIRRRYTKVSVSIDSVIERRYANPAADTGLSTQMNAVSTPGGTASNMERVCEKKDGKIRSDIIIATGERFSRKNDRIESKILRGTVRGARRSTTATKKSDLGVIVNGYLGIKTR